MGFSNLNASLRPAVAHCPEASRRFAPSATVFWRCAAVSCRSDSADVCLFVTVWFERWQMRRRRNLLGNPKARFPSDLFGFTYDWGAIPSSQGSLSLSRIEKYRFLLWYPHLEHTRPRTSWQNALISKTETLRSKNNPWASRNPRQLWLQWNKRRSSASTVNSLFIIGRYSVPKPSFFSSIVGLWRLTPD